MFYELRTYRLRVGATPAYLALVQETGIALQKKRWCGRRQTLPAGLGPCL
jgi:hypothetical protein